MIITGEPGTGKTHRLIEIVKQEILDGVSPTRIAFVSFTNAAADEAKARVGLEKKEMPHFRTIHSMAFRELSLSEDGVITREDFEELSIVTGEDITGSISREDPMARNESGDRLLAIDEYARMVGISLQEAWHKVGINVDWFRLKRFSDAFASYKHDICKMDFTDMLTTYIEDGDPIDIDVAIVDEAQDLTPAQWKVIDHAFSKASRMYIAGDDDQSIYAWSGADLSRFIHMEDEREVLGKSHRLPKAIQNFSRSIIERVGDRIDKRCDHNGQSGSVKFISFPAMIGSEINLNNDHSWLLIARAGYMLKQFEHVAIEQGVPYRIRNINSFKKKEVKAIQAWEMFRKGKEVRAEDVKHLVKLLDLPVKLEGGRVYSSKEIGLQPSQVWFDALVAIPQVRREYYRSCMRNGYKLTERPIIRLDTIHGSKGAEAQEVVVMTDVSRSTQDAMEVNPDSEHRVFYVAATRASQKLHVVLPGTQRFYGV